jgi:hypothetical protein
MATSPRSNYFFFVFTYTIDLPNMYIRNFGDDSFKANDPPYGLELLSKSARHEARLITLIYTANGAADQRLTDTRACSRGRLAAAAA